MTGSPTQRGSEGFVEFYKEHPFAFGGAVSMAGVPAWLVMPWWAIGLAALAGFATGFLIDSRNA
jgi:hypothetical protein